MSLRNVIITLIAAGTAIGLIMFGDLYGGREEQTVHSQGNVKYLIGVSHPNLNGPWQIQMNKEIKKEISHYKDTRVIFTDAVQNDAQQVRDIHSLMNYGIDLLIVSVDNANTLTPVISEVYKKIPVIVLGRGVKGYDYTLYIGFDNQLNGKMAAKEAISLLGNKRGKIIQVEGNKDSLQAEERTKGFEETIKRESSHTIIRTINGNWMRDKAEDELKLLLKSGMAPDLIYAQNDAMALGAYRALQDFKIKGVRIIGSDGLNEENGGLRLVKKGTIDATYITPTGGIKAVQYAMDILHKVPGLPKKIILRDHKVTKNNVDTYLRSFNNDVTSSSKNKHKRIKLGFAQVGSESEWRLANTDSIVSAAKKSGIDLLLRNADYSQKKQIDIIRKFIKQHVDVIAFSPKTEEGWEGILKEAKEAGIPVILSDREVDVEDQTLWTSFLGSDFVEEGRRAGKWLSSHFHSAKPVHIIELEGTVNSAPAVDRKQGFNEIIKQNPNFSLLHSYAGDFTMNKGKKLMEKALAEYGKEINVVYAHNDDMALGAIEAIEEYGLKPGQDIVIISIDATKKAFNSLSVGKMNFTVECSPLLGPQLMKAVKDLENGIEIPQRIITSEETFDQKQAKKMLYQRAY
ncbi:substrate-binding domain-containing protein [Peribacillus kribbensis]|uniref:substrate-binding domain-containing protein n=1 Tax=Peribacillus kribbensis TaxID=356658 RepID=UPI000401BC89|nr:substrate-binding domain-containing protein [Peribacillus kribbensis]